MSAHNYHRTRDMAMQFDTIKDPGDGGAIGTLKSGLCKMVSGGGGETRTLADPVAPGLEIQLSMMTDGSDIVVTVASAINESGNTTLTFADVGDMAILRSSPISATAYVWRDTIGDAGPALS